MNEELKKQLAGLIDKASAAGEKVWDFAAKEAPELIRQLLAWKFFEAVALATVSLVVAVTAAFLLRAGIRRVIKDEYDTPCIPMIIFGVLFSLTGAGVFGVNLFHAVQIHIAPKVYLIEYISGLRK